MGAVIDRPTNTPAPVLKPGATVGTYEIVDTLGQGGMGVVYRARHIELGRTVALKVLSSAFANDREFVERFRREARALASLSHPNIVQVYDYGVAGDLPYLAMEFVDGVSLRRLLSERRLPADEALHIVPQLCDALEYAHGMGIVHRDIKPENILVGRDGRVRIADFGIAKMLRRGEGGLPTLTGTDMMMGTPNYMAPEQRESFRSVDHRADIFSMGVVFYEMLTGELPLGRFHPPSRKAAVNSRLDQIVLRTLEKEPAERYQRAREVKEDLTHVGSCVVHAGPGARRSGGPWLLVAGCLAVVVFGGVLLAGAAFFLMARPVAASREMERRMLEDRQRAIERAEEERRKAAERVVPVPAPVAPGERDETVEARRAFDKLEIDLQADMANGEFAHADALRNMGSVKALILKLDPSLREKLDKLEREYQSAYEAAAAEWVRKNLDDVVRLEAEKKYDEAIRLMEAYPKNLRRSPVWAELQARIDKLKADKER
jgi:predicted Ser/Thr protein kinase